MENWPNTKSRIESNHENNDKKNSKKESINHDKFFSHGLDKSLIPTCNILGVNIAVINMEWLIKYITNNISQLSGDYICISNVHTTVMAFEEPEYLRIQNGGIMAIPDGGPLSSIGRKRGYKEMERITGLDLMEHVFMISAEHGYRHFFYGSTEKTLEKIQKRLEDGYPGIKIAGMYSPPFRPAIKEDGNVLKYINESKPDFIWVGLGAPKQEKWMAIHQGLVEGLMIGVGAGFDFFAGNINRAPRWMQKLNLEWVYRLIQDPQRLFGRYWHTNARFVWETMVKGR